MWQTDVHVEGSDVVGVGAAEILRPRRLVQHQTDRTAGVHDAPVLRVPNRVPGAARAAS